MTDFFVNPRRPDNTGNGLTLATAKKTISAVNALTVANDTIFYAPGEYERADGNVQANIFNIALQPGTVIIIDNGVGSYRTMTGATQWVSCDGLVFKGFTDAIFDWTGGASTNQYLDMIRCRFTEFGTGGKITKHHATSLNQRYRFCTFDNCTTTGGLAGNNVQGITNTDGILAEFSNNLMYNNDIGAATLVVFDKFTANLNGVFNNIFLDNTCARILFANELDANITTNIGGIDNNCYFGNIVSGDPFKTLTGDKATFALWKTDTGQDSQAIETDPQLVDPVQGSFQVQFGGNADEIGSDGLALGAHGRGFGLTNNTFPTQWQNPVKTGPGSTILNGDDRELVTGPDVTEEFPEIDLGAIYEMCRITMEAIENFPLDFINEDATTGKKTVLWRFGTSTPLGGAFVQQEVGSLFLTTQNVRYLQMKPKYNG